MSCGKGYYPVEKKCEQVPYADKVKFYVDQNKKTIITSDVKYLGKGWTEIRVGNHAEKTRADPLTTRNRLLTEYYPHHNKEISTFSELSYHSAIGQDKVGKIDTYGTKDYMKDFSIYKKEGKYTLLQPVKTLTKKDFGKEIKKLDMHQWRYVVVNWTPKGSKTVLVVKDTVHNPITGKEKVLYESKELPESKKNEAIKLFLRRVNEAKKW